MITITSSITKYITFNIDGSATDEQILEQIEKKRHKNKENIRFNRCKLKTKEYEYTEIDDKFFNSLKKSKKATSLICIFEAYKIFSIKHEQFQMGGKKHLSRVLKGMFDNGYNHFNLNGKHTMRRCFNCKL